ncbi:MAG: HPr kinase/phosphatase C-terminal domain-containing protein [Pseudomonadota bacterium]
MPKIESGPVHGTAVTYENKGVLILGASGSGKSQLAGELITRGAVLVSDDQVLLSPGDHITLSPPDSIQGKFEVRGVGILILPFVQMATLNLVVDLDAQPSPRYPVQRSIEVFGHSVPWIAARGMENPAMAVILRLSATQLE